MRRRIDEKGQDRPPWRAKIRASERRVHLLCIDIVLKVEYQDMTLHLLLRALIHRHESTCVLGACGTGVTVHVPS
jgi:hypothetical protein